MDFADSGDIWAEGENIISAALSRSPAGLYFKINGWSATSIRCCKNCRNSPSIDFWVWSACLEMVIWNGSGRETHGKDRLKNNIEAWAIVRGNVANPTHHHDRRNLVFPTTDSVDGSNAWPSEKTLATKNGRSVELSVNVRSRGLFPESDGKKGSEAETE